MRSGPTSQANLHSLPDRITLAETRSKHSDAVLPLNASQYATFVFVD
jgi:hypothetical protein